MVIRPKWNDWSMNHSINFTKLSFRKLSKYFLWLLCFWRWEKVECCLLGITRDSPAKVQYLSFVLLSKIHHWSQLKVVSASNTQVLGLNYLIRNVNLLYKIKLWRWATKDQDFCFSPCIYDWSTNKLSGINQLPLYFSHRFCQSSILHGWHISASQGIKSQVGTPELLRK